jgi:hypothetical protein
MAPQLLKYLLPALMIIGLAGSTTTGVPDIDSVPYAPTRYAPMAHAVSAAQNATAVANKAMGASSANAADSLDDGGATIEVRGANDERRSQIEKALARFEEAGLELPSLIIEWHDDRSRCNGNGGLFRWGGDIARVELCMPETFVIFHELGHAWDVTNLTDDDRQEFLRAAGLTVWSDASTPWKERGCEVAANTIAIGLAYRELSDSDLPLFEEELALYETLTGRPSPRIAD